ncbi:MAG: discoidin domain-containing protein, partial [Sarcina sp.]
DNEKIRYILKNYSEWAVEINKVLSNLKRGTSLGDGIDFGVEVNNAKESLESIVRKVIAGEKPIVSIALNKPATSSPSEAAYGRGAEKGNDGLLNTRWCANTGDASHWWQVDLLDFYDINQVQIIWEKNETYGFAVEVSADNVSWRVAFNNTNNLKKEQVSLINISEKSIRYVKVQIKSLPAANIYASFFECNIFGVLSNVFELAKGFSNSQGMNGWYYKEVINGVYSDLTYNANIGNGIWQGTHEWSRIYKPSMLHPGPTQDIVLAFKCPKSGNISITGNVKKDNIGGGNGVRVNIKYNNNKIWPIEKEWQTINYNDSIGYNQDITIDVLKDDYIYFNVNNNGNGDIAYDNTFWNPVITYIEGVQQFKEVTVFSTEQDGYATTRIPGMVCTSNGTLIAYCEGRSSGSDWATMDLVIKRSMDGGETWSNSIVLFDG